ncbi:hypothetical protein N4T77_10205 [Clostridium sp. CX1]|uniref:Uncharacterized protein n=1 Tax=Clostridium tanneri TaxID=3037988 RepID=A0ABU4JY06_9CLOT|nr:MULTISPECIES: hypothetical protein [unclassified Clostridium]MCT8976976.1 hypothetical protein [Clostridium sp. CX1]MDW8803049.1 hypothetical protein [Clostridium sp. A1-XYC3]
MKNKMKSIGASGALFGIILSRWITNHYGKNGNLVVGVCAFIILVLYFIIVAYKTKKYLGMTIVLIMLSPLIVMLLGVYLENSYVILGGIILLFVSCNLMIKKIVPWLQSRKK